MYLINYLIFGAVALSLYGDCDKPSASEGFFVMEEIWIPIKGYETRYEISNFGRIKSLPKWTKNRCSGYIRPEKIFTGKTDNKGYKGIELVRGHGLKIHRLVGLHFIPNPENKPYINHLDGNKGNNHVTNLEWCTGAENELHAYATGLKKAAYLGKFGKDHNQSIPVIAIKDVIVLEFESKTECGVYFGLTVQAIHRSVKYGSITQGYKIYNL